MTVINLMMRNFNHILILFFISLFISCNSQNCNDFQDNFTSHEQALNLIKKTNFTFTDKCNTQKSSWISGAEYYSCDIKKGYILITIKNKTYTHKDLPIDLWEDFKNAESFGKFYNNKIKGKYQLII